MKRRDFLKWAGVTGLSLALPSITLAAPRTPPSYLQLQKDILEAIGGQEMALDLRTLTPDNTEVFRIEHNTDKLYPVASCFKAFLTFYYFWYTPKDLWDIERESPVYRTAVFSDNVMTGVVLRDVGQYVNIYGNAIEKFNDFLLFMLGLKNGLHTWKWEGSPVAFLADRRFAASQNRYTLVKGIRHPIDNLFTAGDLATGYEFMLRAAAGNAPKTVMSSLSSFDALHAAECAQAALDLLSIPAKNYRSPLERSGFTDYTGKDGILPNGDISAGNVVADAGIIPLRDHRCVIAFMSVGQTEYSAVKTLKLIAEMIRQHRL
jgi:hypothetical protein